MRLGLIDLDTSHPAGWTPLLKKMGHEITAIYDGGTVLYPEQAAKFAADHQIPVICERLDQMIPLVDGVIIHSCNWDTHVERARPFINANKTVMLDKPMASTLSDLHQIIAWADAGKRVTGGSCMRFTPEAAQFLARPVAERGNVRIVLAGCGTDAFNYGVHAYAMLWSIMGPGARTVRWLASSPQWQAEVVWDDNRRGIVSVGGNVGWLRTYATVITDKSVSHLVSSGKPDVLYQPLLDAVMPYLSGGKSEPPLSVRELIEPEIAAVAALESYRRGGTPVSLESLAAATVGYDGAAFAAEYAAQKRKR